MCFNNINKTDRTHKQQYFRFPDRIKHNIRDRSSNDPRGLGRYTGTD